MVALLERLIPETVKFMLFIKYAANRNDRNALDGQVHRLRSSWAVIRADRPLWKLHELLHRDEECSNDEIKRAVDSVLKMGDMIMELARKEKKEEVR